MLKKDLEIIKKLVLSVALAAMSLSVVYAAEPAKVTLVFDQPIPNIPGKSMRGVLVEYGPCAASLSHTHPPSAFIYATVLEGAVRTKINNDPEKVLQVGENFYEMPGDHHGVSAIASAEKPARVLAVFIVNTGEKSLTGGQEVSSRIRRVRRRRQSVDRRRYCVVGQAFVASEPG